MPEGVVTGMQITRSHSETILSLANGSLRAL